MRIGTVLTMLSVLAVAPSVGAALDTRIEATTFYEISFDGKSIGATKSVEGGGIRANVIRESTGAVSSSKKHIGSPVIEPIKLKLGTGAINANADLIDALMTNNLGSTRKTVGVLDCNASGKATTERSFRDALLTEVSFPKFEAQAKEQGVLTLSFTPDSAQRGKSSATCAAGGAKAQKEKAWSPGNFRFELDGIDTKGVAAIDAFSVKQTSVENTLGDQRDYAREPGKLEIPDLTLSVSRSNVEGFEKWAEDFIVKGNSGEQFEKSGAIVVLDQSLTTELMRVSLSHVGIARLSLNKDDAARVDVQLYVEEMRFSVNGIAPKAAKVAKATVAAKAAPAKLTPAKAAAKKAK